MISTADLAAMRSTLDGSLPDTCQVVRRTSASDGALGTNDTWANQGAAVACRVAPASKLGVETEAELVDVLRAETRWTITLPALTDVTERDRITSGGRTFEVVSVLGPRSLEIGRRALCLRIN